MNPALLLFGVATGYYFLTNDAGKNTVFHIGAKAPVGLVPSLARKWSGVYNIPEAWILAVCKIESANRPSAVRNVGGDAKRGGAFGLMQMTWKTALSIAPHLAKSTNPEIRAAYGRWGGTKEGLLDPDINMMFGAYYLSAMKARHGDDFRVVAAGYNGGNGAALAYKKGKPYNLAYIEKAQKAAGLA